MTSGGYVGLSIATLLSQHHKVMAVDIVPEKVELINSKKSPIQDEYIEKYLAEKELNLTATLDAKEAYSDADFVVIAAPTNYDSKKNFFDNAGALFKIKDKLTEDFLLLNADAMIPFWKKTGKHSKSQSVQKRRQNTKPAVPRTAQQSIPMQRMFEDGTCRVKPNYYTRTIQYQDINYQLAQQEDKTAIFEEWCSFLNFFDSSIKFELSFVNMATDSTEFEKSIRIPFQKDGFDDVRAEYSQMLRQQLAKGNNGLTKTKFITFGVEGESMAQVKPRLDHIQNDLLNNFHRLGVQAKPLNGVQRLKLMHDMFNMDGASKFHFDWKDLVKSGLSVKDAIAPTAFAFKNSRTFQMGGIFCAASFLSITASDISDQLLKDFLDMDSSQIVTMHIQSVDQNRAIKTVKRTITELDRSKIEEQKKAIRAGYDIDISATRS